jgi:hypothetical protein
MQVVVQVDFITLEQMAQAVQAAVALELLAQAQAVLAQ